MDCIKTFEKTFPRISTMTVTANWGTQINRDILFRHLIHLMIPIWYPGEGILKLEHNNTVCGASYKDLFTNRKTTGKTFFNQSTIVIRRRLTSGWKEVNMKLFANGGIQMTGIPSEEFAIQTIHWLLAQIKIFSPSPFSGEVIITKISVPLINTDFTINKDIQQDILQNILVDTYNLISTLEKTIYQGINMKYFFNSNNINSGVCCCNSYCDGFGNGDGDGKCKRITVSIFRTGKIIITGAMNLKQINTAYDFICGVIDKYSDTVLIHKTKPLENISCGKCV